VKLSVALVLPLLLAVGRAAVPPVEDFARLPEFENLQLSPDGKLASLLRREPRGGVVLMWDLASRKVTRFESWSVYDGDGTRPTAGIRDYRWLTPGRLLIRTEGSVFNDYTYAGVARASLEAAIANADLPANVSREEYRANTLANNQGTLRMAESSAVQRRTTSGYFATNLDGRDRIELPGADKDGPLGNTYFLWDTATLQVSRKHAGSFFMAYSRDSWHGQPNFGRVISTEGRVLIAAEKPGPVNEWVLDWDDEVRLGVARLPTTTKLWQRPEPGKPWRELTDLALPPAHVAFHRFDPAGKVVYASRVEAGGNWVLTTYSLETRQWGEPQLRNSRYDIAAGDDALAFAEANLTAPVFSARTRDLAGVRFVADGPRQLWFEPRWEAAQKTIDAKLPGKVNMILGANADESRFTVLSWSARDPGSYNIFDTATGGIARLAQRRAWLKAEEMGETFPFKCRTDDGVELDGYVTRPPGATAGPRPTVVLFLRDEPWRRDVWGFDPWVQFLATRGYAVLQVNARGSRGYGPAFHAAGRDDPGTVASADLATAVRWAVRTKLADPQRVALVGRGFGGACTLLALGRESHPYRCGVAVEGVIDWAEVLRNAKSPAGRHWAAALGLPSAGPERDAWARAATVPPAERLRTPLLLVQANNAVVTPFPPAKALAAALEKAGRAPQTFFYASTNRTAESEPDLAAVWGRIESFLKAHLLD